MYLKPVDFVAVPPGVTTTIVRTPAVPAGSVAVILDDVAVRTVATAPPTLTVRGAMKLLPSIVSVEPPRRLADVGDTVVIVGAAT